MRLIDANALMEIIRAHDYPLTAHYNSTDNGMFTLGIQQAVDECPTIETPRGKWDLHNNSKAMINNTFYTEWYTCSECGVKQDNISYYCPYCGAKMEGIS